MVFVCFISKIEKLRSRFKVDLEVDLGSILRPLGSRFGSLLEADLGLIWKPLGGRFGVASDAFWRSLGSLLQVSGNSPGSRLEVCLAMHYEV